MLIEKYDLAVIGGGPAGMLAAGRAGELGRKTVLIEKNKYLGVKLLATGNGRCNITNAKEDLLKNLTEIYGKNGRFLYSAFYHFSNQDTQAFFKKQGLEIKEERGGRIFPVSDKAQTVLNCLKKYLKQNGVKIKISSPLKKIVLENEISGKPKIKELILENKEIIRAKNYLIATGGKSYPRTGSSGDGHQWLKKMGHTLTPLSPVLVPIIVWEKEIVKELEGLSLRNITVSLWEKRKLLSLFGELLFTENGLSGPLILNLTRKMGGKELSNLSLKINLKPALDYPSLDRRVRRDFEKQNNKQFKNSLGDLLPQKLIPVFIKLSGIKGEKPVNQITREERKKLIGLLREWEFKIEKLADFDQAIVTRGGVKLKEVDPRTLRSRLVDNLYLAGEILDIDGPAGGYNLQVAWSTGYLAGELK